MDVEFSLLRSRMVESQIRTTDVTDTALLDAMAAVAREEFVADRMKPLAYIDEDIPVDEAGEGPLRYLMEPSPFARLIQLAGIRPGDVVLDVGCATGYSSAILSHLAGSVVALECDPRLAAQASQTLGRLGCDNVAVVEGPLEEGYRPEAPYDVIFVGGAVDFVPAALTDQLRDGGRLVAVVGNGNAGMARAYIRSDDIVTGRRAFNAAVRPLPGFRAEPAFTF